MYCWHTANCPNSSDAAIALDHENPLLSARPDTDDRPLSLPHDSHYAPSEAASDAYSHSFASIARPPFSCAELYDGAFPPGYGGVVVVVV